MWINQYIYAQCNKKKNFAGKFTWALTRSHECMYILFKSINCFLMFPDFFFRISHWSIYFKYRNEYGIYICICVIICFVVHLMYVARKANEENLEKHLNCDKLHSLYCLSLIRRHFKYRAHFQAKVYILVLAILDRKKYSPNNIIIIKLSGTIWISAPIQVNTKSTYLLLHCMYIYIVINVTICVGAHAAA